ncbi:hypothetical protein BUE80_DR008775 [Diplocarpon rosae]|nr:hypothetical protein BUE80_DR008775 [Diplocarpon rosae]
MDGDIAKLVNVYGHEEPRAFLGVASSTLGTPRAADFATWKAITSPATSPISAVESSSKRSDSDSASRRSSVSTVLSTAPSTHQDHPSTGNPPPWHSNRAEAMTPVVYDYDLPCEFAAHGCLLRFHAERYEEWIAHTISHFVGFAPPPSTVCIFCDDFYFNNPNDPYSNWRERMVHVGQHYQEHHVLERSRPDYLLTEYLHKCGLIASDEYERIISFSERQPCQHLVEDGFQSPEMKQREHKKSRTSERIYDLRKEERQMRNKDGQVRKNDTYRSSNLLQPKIRQEGRP